MARTPALTDEQIAEIAREMLERGELTTRGLQDACRERGSADRKRVVDIARAVREESQQAANGLALLAGSGNNGTDGGTELPPDLREAVLRIPTLMAACMEHLRREGAEHARLQAAAVRAEHASHLGALRRELEALEQERSNVAEDATRLETDRDAAQKRVAELEQQLAQCGEDRVNSLQQATAERERLQAMLQDSTAREVAAQNVTTEAQLARRDAETECRTLNALYAERVEELAGLRQEIDRVNTLLREAERERDVAQAMSVAAAERATRAERREEEMAEQLRDAGPAKQRAPRRRSQSPDAV